VSAGAPPAHRGGAAGEVGKDHSAESGQTAEGAARVPGQPLCESAPLQAATFGRSVCRPGFRPTNPFSAAFFYSYNASRLRT